MATIIGKLKAIITADIDDLDKNIDKARKKLGDFELSLKGVANLLKKGFAVAVAAATAAVGAIGTAVGFALRDFDRMAKMSRAIGVPTEELSKLEHAAELSGVKIEEVGKAFGVFARQAREASRAPNDFSAALDSMGIAWRDASGNILRADQVMLNVADKFKGMEDGAGKTAIAMRLYGEELGPKFINLLNNGSAGIAEMTAEAEKLGLVFNHGAAEAAERFNDQLSRVIKVGGGFTTQLTNLLLPTLEKIVDRFYDWATAGSGVKNMAYSLASAFNSVVEFALKTVHAIDALWARTKLLADNVSGIFSETMETRQDRIKAVNAKILAEETALQNSLVNMWRDFEAVAQGWRANIEGPGGKNDTPGVKPPKVVALEQENAALQLLNQAETERKAIMEAMQSPYEKMIADQTRLNELFGASKHHAELLARTTLMTTMTMQNAYAGAAASISGALTNLFNKSKGVAIANALINTYEAVTSALKNPPGPPFSYAYAAAALANGMAQVNAIRSTSSSGGGGGGGSIGQSAAAAPEPAQRSSHNIHLSGVSSGTFLSDTMVRELVGRINEIAGDNVTISVGA